jgi:hypothetical protein
VDFSSGKAGFVRKVLRAGILQNSRIEKDLRAICPAKVRDSGGLECFCPAKVRFAKRFLEKPIG